MIYLTQTYGPKAISVLLPSYVAYANANPTHTVSHPFHTRGPREFGALGAAPHTEIHLAQIQHIQTVYPHLSIESFTDPNGVPNISITKYRIHSDPAEYIRWRNKLPMQYWSQYGLDKPMGAALTNDVLMELKNMVLWEKRLFLKI